MITVREGLTDDLLAAIASQMVESLPIVAMMVPRPIVEATIRSMARRARFFGVYDGDQPVGYYSFRLAGWSEPRGQVHMGVDPAYHGRWITKGVLRHMLGTLFEHQNVAVVSVRGAAGQRFCEHFGFKFRNAYGTSRIYEMRQSDALPHRSPYRSAAA